MRKALLWNILVGSITAFITQKMGYSPLWGLLGSFVFGVLQLVWMFIVMMMLIEFLILPILIIVLTYFNGHRDPREGHRRGGSPLTKKKKPSLRRGFRTN